MVLMGQADKVMGFQAPSFQSHILSVGARFQDSELEIFFESKKENQRRMSCEQEAVL